MLKKLTQLKNRIIVLNIYNKINMYLPKIHKTQIINQLVVIYSNLKNNTLKTTQIDFSELNIRNLYIKFIILLVIIESLLIIFNV